MLARNVSIWLGFVVIAVSFAAPARAKNPPPFEQVEFPSEDGLSITADLYKPHGAEAPFIVLFHQAGWSRGEYREIAPRLTDVGFNCLAVDQRSGKAVDGVRNETARRARKGGKGTTYVDALPDMRAALRYARKHHAKGKVIAWGSSYSSALVLVIAGDNPELVDGTLSFAPGEYFAKYGKTRAWIRTATAKIRTPTFITSAKSEQSKWKKIAAAVPDAAGLTTYLPKTRGQHGSRALWKKFDDSDGYWTAVTAFLAQFRP